MQTDPWRDSLAYQSDEAVIGLISAGRPHLDCQLSLMQSLWLDAHRGVARFQDPFFIAARSGANISRAWRGLATYRRAFAASAPSGTSCR